MSERKGISHGMTTSGSVPSPRMSSADHANRLFLSAALTVPAAYYLYTSGPQETAHGAGPKRPLVKGPEEGAKVSGEKQSERDPVSAVSLLVGWSILTSAGKLNRPTQSNPQKALAENQARKHPNSKVFPTTIPCIRISGPRARARNRKVLPRQPS